MKHKQNWNECKEQISQYREAGCCTVTALANTMDWSFGKAHRYMKKFGRRDRCGMSLIGISHALRNLGKESSSDCNGMTINRFVKSHAVAI